MNGYSDWYDFVVWTQDAWDIALTSKEIAVKAHMLWLEYQVYVDSAHEMKTFLDLKRKLFITPGGNEWLERMI